MSHHHGGLGAIVILQQSLLEATLAVRAPVGLLGVIGLEHVSTLHLKGDHQEWSGVRVGLSSLSKFDVAWHLDGILLSVSQNCKE